MSHAQKWSITIGCIVGIVMAGAFWARGRHQVKPSAHQPARVIYIIFSMGFAGYILALIGVIAMNQLLDHGPASSHLQKVLDRDADSKGKKWLTVSSWEPIRPAVRFQVSAEAYNQAARDARIRISTKPGFFGWEWIASYQILSK